MSHTIEQHGFAIVHGVMDESAQRELLSALGPAGGAGRRGLLAVPEVAAIARAERVLRLVRRYLRREPVPVRAIFFDKTPEANWLVPWHQDLSLAVRKAMEIPGFGPWSVKDGIPHVQPPVELLEQMLTVRLHFDDAGGANGALRVLPGSHRMGRLSADRIREVRGGHAEVLCEVAAGDALLMRPLLLHASQRAVVAGHRRVLHIEYAGFALPEPLEWSDGK